MNFLIPCFLIETLLWAMLCNKNREDQAPIPPTPTNPHPSGRLARPLFSWQSRPRGGEARLADTRHAECHMMIYPDNFFPNKFTGKVNCEIFAEQKEQRSTRGIFCYLETRREFLTHILRLQDETEKYPSISEIQTKLRFLSSNSNFETRAWFAMT